MTTFRRTYEDMSEEALISLGKWMCWNFTRDPGPILQDPLLYKIFNDTLINSSATVIRTLWRQNTKDFNWDTSESALTLFYHRLGLRFTRAVAQAWDRRDSGNVTREVK